MNGIIAVDKPAGFTSFDVVAKMRGICGTRKIGHGGTLDPMATGVLPIFVGNAAKAVDLAPCQDKAYEALVRFGVATDTGDITGQVLKESAARVSLTALTEVLPRFLGEQTQVPPMYSAVKVDGKPLYKYAREGKQVERKTRKIVIYSLKAEASERENEYVLRVACGKGTYIRTLAEDIGGALGVPATLAGLRRTQSGVFTEGMAVPLEAVQAAKDGGTLDALVHPVEVLFEGLPPVAVDAGGAKRLSNGVALRGVAGDPGRSGAADGSALCRIIGPHGFLGLGRLAADGTLRGVKLFRDETMGDG